MSDQALSDHGLSYATAIPLLVLSRHGENVRQGVLADELGIEGPSLVRLIDLLQSEGLVERREDPTDRRAKTLHLTAAGDAKVEETNRVLRLVVPALGFPSADVGYRRDERAAGESKYPLSKMIRLTLDSVTGVSSAPLRLATWFGLAGFVLAFAVAAFAVVSKLTGHSITGWASTIVVVSGFGALQLLCLGVLGEYVGRLFQTAQARPTHYVAYDSLEESALGRQPSIEHLAPEPAVIAHAS